MKDLTGYRFGKLLVLEISHRNKKTKNVHWKCQCDCGNISTPNTASLKNGTTKSCGKCGRLTKDLTGRKFGKLIVIEKSHNSGEAGNWTVYWKCQCDCGNTSTPTAGALLSGHSTTCGKNHNSLRTDSRLVSARRVFENNYNDADITFEQFVELSQRNCHYCDAAPSNKIYAVGYKNPRHNEYLFVYNGLDRVDNTKLHTLDNVVPCCRICNCAKSNKTKEEFLAWIVRAYTHSISNVT